MNEQETSPIAKPFAGRVRLVSASVPGTDHVQPGKPNWKNNQDAVCTLQKKDGRAIGIVCDGCGSGAHSEIGAFLGAHRLAHLIDTELNQPGSTPFTLDWNRLRTHLVSHLQLVTLGIGTDRSHIIRDTFLFTIVGCVITENETVIFSLGDGVYAINGVVQNLGPFPDNAPPYLMYEVTGAPMFDRDPELRHFKVLPFKTAEIRTLMVGTDGVEDLLAAEERCFPGTQETVGPFSQLLGNATFENPDKLRRHLARANRETTEQGRILPGLLHDDTTLILVQIEPVEAAR